MTTKAHFYRHKATGETAKAFTLKEDVHEGGRDLLITVPIAPLAGAQSQRALHSWLGEKEQFSQEFEISK